MSEQVRVEVDGVGIVADVRGDGEPVLVLHGFTGSAAAMAPLTSLLEQWRVIVPDLVGHGRSDVPATSEAYTVAAMTNQLAGLLDELGHDAVNVVGYSMGGRIALNMGCAAPERVRSLVLIGATPGISDDAARAERCREDEDRARRAEANLQSFIDRWMANPLFAGQARLGPDYLAASRAQRLKASPLGLANSLRGGGTGSMPPLHDRLDQCVAPTCLVAGEHDSKFRAIAEEMAGSMPHAELSVITNSGHATHIEQQGATAEIVSHFIGRVAS